MTTGSLLKDVGFINLVVDELSWGSGGMECNWNCTEDV
jgi:hypothetical protein